MTLSVVIPLYNHERFIDAALDSVLAQSVQPDEIIVLDDGSTDGSLARATERARHEPRILVRTHPNQGAHATINAAIRMAHCDHVAILNSDDCYLPGRFAACLQALQSDPQAAAVCTALRFLDDRGRTISNPWYEGALRFYREQQPDMALALVNGNFPMTTSNLFVRRSTFEAIGLFANLRYAHDLDFMLRLLGSGRRLLWLDEPHLAYRLHATNTIKEGELRVKAEWAAVVACFAWRLQAGPRADWPYLDQLADILDQHRLTRIVFHFFKWFQGRAPEEVSVDDWVDDPRFKAFLAATVR